MRTWQRALAAQSIPILCLSGLVSALMLTFPYISQAIPVSHFVSTTGVDAGDCVASLCRTIQFAIGQSASGDTVLVSPGSYLGAIALKSGISVRSLAGSSLTTIDGGRTGSTVDFARSTGASLSGFTITGGLTSFGGGVSLDFSPSGSLTRNIIEGNIGGIGGAISCNGCSVLIDSNLIRNNTTNASGEPPPAALADFNSGSPIITNNIIVGNRGPAAIQIGAPLGNNTLFANNTIDGNDGFGAALDNLGGIVFRNNLVTNNRGGGIRCGLHGPGIVDFNDVFGNSGGDFLDSGAAFCSQILASGADFSFDPRYVDAAGGDYHLTAGSPAIGIGSLVGAPTTDFEGNPRPLGRGIDLGAYEFRAVPEPGSLTLISAGLLVLGALATRRCSRR